MAVRIPESPRVIYARNPLTEVIVQVRFPRILRIENELPATFQEAIRARFPLYEDMTVEVGADLPLPPSRTRIYRFMSEDMTWTVTLTSEFLALTTTRYERWETFEAQLAQPLAALFDVYAAHHASRIGLRYVDVVRRSQLGLSGVAWQELIQPAALGEWLSLADEDDVLGLARDVLLQLDDGARARLRHGLVRSSADPESAYRIDADFFVEDDRARSAAEVLDVLRQFKTLSGRLFRSLIQTRLHEAMGPKEVVP